MEGQSGRIRSEHPDATSLIASPSPSNDRRVQNTNDEANVSKASAANLEYYEDAFVRHFTTTKRARRSPLINRGYFIRIAALRSLLRRLVKASVASNAGGLQIISLGAGYDTTPFQLASEGAFDGAGIRYVEVDFPELTQRKADVIRSHACFGDVLASKNFAMAVVAEDDAPRLPPGSNAYALLGHDLRDLDGLEACLVNGCGVHLDAPTVLFTECVLNYVPTDAVDRLLVWLRERFPNAIFVSYDQQGPLGDGFGQAMMGALGARGSPLLSLPMHASRPAVVARYIRCGWEDARAVSMAEQYYLNLDPALRARVEALEVFDEWEDWHVMSAHYCLSWAFSPIKR